MRKFNALPLRYKLILPRIGLLLGWYRASTLHRPLAALTADLTHHAEAPLPIPVSSNQLEEADVLGSLVAAVARRTPWRSPCLTQVLVMRRLLQARGISGRFHLGVAQDSPPPGSDSARQRTLFAHAWVECGSCIVNGKYGREDYTIVSSYSWRDDVRGGGPDPDSA